MKYYLIFLAFILITCSSKTMKDGSFSVNFDSLRYDFYIPEYNYYSSGNSFFSALYEGENNCGFIDLYPKNQELNSQISEMAQRRTEDNNDVIKSKITEAGLENFTIVAYDFKNETYYYSIDFPSNADIYQYHNNEWEFLESIVFDSGKEIYKYSENLYSKAFKDDEAIALERLIESKINTKISQKWHGTYLLALSDGQNVAGDWVEFGFELNIREDSCIFSGGGYQFGFYDLCVPDEKSDTLFLYHYKNIWEMDLGSSFVPEAILYKINNTYYLNSKWLPDEVKKPTKYGFPVKKNEGLSRRY